MSESQNPNQQQMIIYPQSDHLFYYNLHITTVHMYVHDKINVGKGSSIIHPSSKQVP